MNERPGEFSKIPRTALPALRDAIVDVYGANELSEKVLEYNVDFATVVPTGVSFGDQVLDLLRHFRKKNTLGSLLGALADGRPDFPEFRTRLVQAIREAPVAEDGDEEDEDEPAGKPRRRWRVPAAARRHGRAAGGRRRSAPVDTSSRSRAPTSWSSICASPSPRSSAAST